MDSKQFAWLYLIEHGLAEVKHSYYGGYDHVHNSPYSKLSIWDYKNLEKIVDASKAKIKEVGVNWNKTFAPETERHSIFNGTCNDAGETEKLEGILVLNDDTKQFWMADKLEVSNVFEMMAQITDAKERFDLLFSK
jgi:hypothetical protein